MNIRIFAIALAALTTASGASFAQVPPDMAAAIKKIGQVVDTPNTAKLYAPLFAEQKEPYPNVSVVRDVDTGHARGLPHFLMALLGIEDGAA